MFGKLESFRGIAACIIVLYHSGYDYWDGGNSMFFVWAHLYVDFFFVLSGFVMYYAYGRKISEGMTFLSYITLRLGRIYPLHFIILITWVPIILLKQYMYLNGFGGTDQLAANPPANFITSLLLINTIGLQDFLGWNAPSWSISSEFLTYICFFLFTLFLDRRQGIVFPILISVICYSILGIYVDMNLHAVTDFGVIRCLGGFYLGVALFRLRSKQILLPKTPLKLSLLECGTIFFSVFCVCIAPNIPGGALLSILSFVIVIYVFSSRLDGVLGWLLNTTVFRKIGVWSYSIYLLHSLVYMILDNIVVHVLKIESSVTTGVNSIFFNLLYLSITIFLARFTYVYIENHFRILIKNRVYQTQPSTQLKPT